MEIEGITKTAKRHDHDLAPRTHSNGNNGGSAKELAHVKQAITLPLEEKTIQVGIIGCGYWGPKLARNFSNLPGVGLQLISDKRPDRLEEMKKLYSDVHVTCDYHDLLKDGTDAVVIATPVHSHYLLAKEALLAGKHVFVEKPLAARVDQGIELAQLAAQLNLTLMVGHTFLYNPAVEAVRQIILSGELGDIFYFNSTRANLGLLQPDINVMWDLAPHDISLMSYILDSKPISVSARGATYINKYRKLHEVVYLTMLFENGVLANLRLSWLDPVKQRSLTVVGSRKMLLYDDIADNKVIIFDKGIDLYPYSITEEEFHASYRHGEEMVYPLAWKEPLQVECEHFIECLRSGARPRSDGEQGVNVLKVLETAERSLQNNGVELFVEY